MDCDSNEQGMLQAGIHIHGNSAGKEIICYMENDRLPEASGQQKSCRVKKSGHKGIHNLATTSATDQDDAAYNLDAQPRRIRAMGTDGTNL